MTTRESMREALPHKRIKLSETLRTYTHRKVLLCLESGVPEDVSWALSGLLVASCPPENTVIVDRSVQPVGRDMLTDTVSIPRNPHILATLLPLAAPPPQSSSSALHPSPPGMATTKALMTAQWRQAWLVIRNMSLMSENEGPFSQCLPLRKLVLRTLRLAFTAHETEPPLVPAELRRSGDALEPEL